ncbi:MAG TPA: DUF6340 family protein [Prolixibacteraceae bacterium]|nr:DUF6340 family protein [Prolixibacteraceae bacterium]
MKRETQLFLFVLLLSMSSCVSYEKFSMEVFKPAEFSLPSDIREIAVVSRNLKYKNDTLQNYQVKNHRLVKDKTRFNTDSLAIKACMDSLSARLSSENQFDKVSIIPVYSFPQMRVNEIRPDRSEYYQNISEKTGADALILLDMFSCFYSQSETNSTPVANVVISNIWSVYNVRKQKITDRFTQVDTLYWDGIDENEHFSKLRIPAKKDAIFLAAGIIGKNYSKHILPAWTKASRNIMTCDKPELKQASELAQKNKWEEASAIWQNYSDSKSKRNKVISVYNLALASEMNGDIDKAIELTAQAATISSGAFMSSENEVVRNYSAVLYRRKIEISKLNAQNDLQ